jgi:type II secretory pathway pseudopilin PulG
MTLIEVLIAAMILTVGLLSLASVAGTSLTSLRDSRERQDASAAATRAIEELRDTAYGDITLDAEPAKNPFDPNESGSPPCPEPVSYDAGNPDAAVDHDPELSSPPFWYETDSGVEIRTYVTSYDDPVVPSDDGTACESDEQDAKRVTVVATWQNGTATRTLRRSTLLAPVAHTTASPSPSPTP